MILQSFTWVFSEHLTAECREERGGGVSHNTNGECSGSHPGTDVPPGGRDLETLCWSP